MTEREINVLVAKKLRMKFRIKRKISAEGEPLQLEESIVEVDGLSEAEREYMPDFHGKTGHAWQIIEAMPWAVVAKTPVGWTCQLGYKGLTDKLESVTVESPVLSHAICTAFLRIPTPKHIIHP